MLCVVERDAVVPSPRYCVELDEAVELHASVAIGSITVDGF